MAISSKTILKSQRGFSMVAILVAAAIGAIIVGGLFESVLLMIRSQRTTEVSRLSDLVGDQIEAVLSNEAACSAAFNTTLPVLSLNATSFPVNLTLTNTPITLHPGADLAPGVKLADYQILDTGQPIVTFTSGGVTQYRRVVTLRIMTQKTNQDLFSPAARPRDIKINMIVDAADIIQGCVAESNETKACEQGGGIWNPLAPVGQKCVPFRYCEWGGSFSTAPVSEGGFPNQLTGGYNCPNSDYIQQQTGAIATAKRSGKTHVYNDLQPIYTCMKCGASILATAPITTQIDAGLDSALSEYDTAASQNAADAAAVHAAQCTAGTGPCP